MSFIFGFIPVYGDGLGYRFLYLHLREGHWSLTSPPAPPPASDAYQFVPARGGWSTFYQIGAPLTWAVLAPLIPLPRIQVEALVARYPAQPYTAVFLLDGLSILTITSLLALVVIGWTAHFASRELGLPPHAAWSGAGIAFFGLPTWYYTFFSAHYAHTTQLFFLTGALILWWRAVQRMSYPFLAASAVLLGCAALVRVDAILFLVPLGIISVRRFGSWRAVGAWIPAGILLLMQFVVWRGIFGTWLPPARYTMGEFSFPLAHAYETLFGAMRGFFVWSPIALLGMIGLCGGVQRPRIRPFAVAGIGVLALYAILYGSWDTWWGGVTFGQRFLIPLYPFLAVGVACGIHWLRDFPRGVRVVSAFGIAVMLIMTVGLGTIHLTLSRTYSETEFFAPWRMVTLLRREYGFPGMASLGPLFQDIFWHGPRVIHVFL